MNNNKPFQSVSSLSPGRSLFDLSYEKKFTCDMGQLIPVMCDEVVPGDVIQFGNEAIVRFQPMLAPILHEINMYVHYFFVPYRILWDDWEKFISGGDDGDFTATLPTWDVTLNGVNSLWDYLGFPTDTHPDHALPIQFPLNAYNFIYNEYYRDQNLVDEVLLTSELVKLRAWEKDYFTSSLPWQQKGTAPALPITGTSSAVWAEESFINGNYETYPINVKEPTGVFDNRFYTPSSQAVINARNALNANTVDLSSATTFDIADLRLASQIQLWMERNARGGSRYTEFLKSHFGVSPRDDRLQRPEYIGGSKTGVIVSEVLQTSSTDATSSQGNLSGHGIAVSEAYCGSYRAKEYGLVMGIMSIMPRTSYQQGINRQWLRRTKYDFYFPEFANLSEQAIENAEICAIDGSTEDNIGIFGYQGRYDEMRTKSNIVCGDMRDDFSFWHLGRIFNPLSPPALNEDFITCNPSKRIFAVPSEPGLVVSFGNLIKAFRPLPIQAEPGE